MYNIAKVKVVVTKYFEEIGVDSSQIASELNENEFINGFITNLATVNVVKQNRFLSNSKQTHIHITGPSMQAFYPLNVLNTATTSTDDERINLKLFNANLSHLTTISEARRSNSEVPSFRFNGEVNLLESSTVKKISARTGQSPQVQISKKRLDGQYFKELRSGLFVDDLLIFLQYHQFPNEYLVIGIPTNLINLGEDVIFTTDLVTNSNIPLQHSVPVQTQSEFSLREVTSDSIANYSNSSKENNDSRVFDLSESIENLSIRTDKHQNIVRNLARFLEDLDFDLYAGNIDCLATKDNQDVLIFEVKTLDGSHSDEIKQVRAALSQLLYYDEFATNQFINTHKNKIAVFDSKITDSHIQFLNKYGIYVMWLDNTDSLTGNDDVTALINSFIIC